MMLHDIVTIIVFALCVWAIVSPHVPTGILATTGLGVLALATLWSLDVTRDEEMIVNAMIGGMGLVGAGVALRVLRRRSPHMRRLSDWGADWASTQPAREIDITEQRHISGGSKTR